MSSYTQATIAALLVAGLILVAIAIWDSRRPR